MNNKDSEVSLNTIGRTIFNQLTEGQPQGGDGPIHEALHKAALAVASVVSSSELTKWMPNANHLDTAIKEAHQIALVSHDDPLQDLNACIRAYLECRMKGGEESLTAFKREKFLSVKNHIITGEHLMQNAELADLTAHPVSAVPVYNFQHDAQETNTTEKKPKENEMEWAIRILKDVPLKSKSSKAEPKEGDILPIKDHRERAKKSKKDSTPGHGEGAG